MKVWMKRSLAATAAAAALLAGATAIAHRSDAGYFGWRPVTAAEVAPLQARLFERAASRLDLDAPQQAKLAVLADRLREARNSVVATSARPRDELAAAMSGTTFDQARINTLVQAQLSTAMVQSPGLVQAAADFYDSLRETQQAQLRDLLARARSGRSANSP
jgi:periplasmic protein CpxP/Spy